MEVMESSNYGGYVRKYHMKGQPKSVRIIESSNKGGLNYGGLPVLTNLVLFFRISMGTLASKE